MEQKYLYAASIKGIQNFIFRTSKLKEIVGASEIVKGLSSDLLRNILKDKYQNENLILSAAGNIKYLASNDDCKKIARELPKKIEDLAPNVTIVQTVVKYDKDKHKIKEVIDEAEEKLKAQRNKQSLSYSFNFMGVETERRTGEPALYDKKTAKIKNKEEYNQNLQSESSQKKIRAQSNESLLKEVVGKDVDIKDRLCLDFEEIGSKDNDQWMAVIHADGNGLGNLIQNMFNDFDNAENETVIKAYRRFSDAIDQATKDAVKKAYKSIKDKISDTEKIPLRPILIGGDDVTIVIRADLAYDFTTAFLEEFEKASKYEMETLHKSYPKINAFKNGLSACAGITYIKAKYPIYYGLHLAEDLCKDAKKMVKKDNPDFIPSALVFYKVQDSFIDNWDIVKKRTLCIPKVNINLFYGPYFVNENKSPNIQYLNKKLEVLKNAENDEKSSASALREIISELYVNKDIAQFKIGRLEQINPDFVKNMDLENHTKEKKKSILNDVITLQSFIKSKKNKDN